MPGKSHWDALIKCPAAREYHEDTKWALNGNIYGLHALHKATIERLNREHNRVAQNSNLCDNGLIC